MDIGFGPTTLNPTPVLDLSGYEIRTGIFLDPDLNLWRVDLVPQPGISSLFPLYVALKFRIRILYFYQKAPFQIKETVPKFAIKKIECIFLSGSTSLKIVAFGIQLSNNPQSWIFLCVSFKWQCDF